MNVIIGIFVIYIAISGMLTFLFRTIRFDEWEDAVLLAFIGAGGIIAFLALIFYGMHLITGR